MTVWNSFCCSKSYSLWSRWLPVTRKLFLALNINYPKFPCKICAKNVSDKVKAVQGDLCELWVHVKCNNLNYLDHRYLQNSNKSWYCIECCSTIFPFNFISNNKNFLACCTNTDNNTTQWINLENDHNSSLSLKPSSNLEFLVLAKPV